MTTTAFDDQFSASEISYSDMIDDLAMKLAEFPTAWDEPLREGFPYISTWSLRDARPFIATTEMRIYKEQWLQRREELINCPPDSEAPEWAVWKCQDSDGWWYWFAGRPAISGMDWHYDEKPHKSKAGKKGETPSGHRWEDTLTRINREDNTSTPEKEEEFARIQARQDAERPHEADARRLGEQLKEAMVECGCGDKYPANSYGAGFTVANGGVCENCDAYESPSSHYSHEYKGIKMDPYRIAKIYNMDGGPREQIMKKTLRFTDKGHTEQQVVNEIRTALDRWQQMIDEDK